MVCKASLLEVFCLIYFSLDTITATINDGPPFNFEALPLLGGVARFQLVFCLIITFR